MNDLISINEQDVNGLTNTVNGRELHGFMEVGKRFTTWIQDRIKSYGFVEGQDYVVTENLSVPDLGSAKARPQMVKQYHLTLDTAKEIAMVERNDKGREARRYFIQCEKQLKAVSFTPDMLANQLSNLSEIVGASIAQLAQVTTVRFDSIENKLEDKTSKEDVDKIVEAKLDNLDISQVLDKKPPGTDSLTGIKRRINEKHGLSGATVDMVLDLVHNAPTFFARVKNEHEESKGATYCIYRISTMTSFFNKFVKECEMVGKNRAKHYMLGDKKFQLKAKQLDRPL